MEEEEEGRVYQVVQVHVILTVRKEKPAPVMLYSLSLCMMAAYLRASESWENVSHEELN